MIVIKIIIRDVEPNKHDCSLVEFESAFGTAQAEWHGNIPKAGREYQVEIDITEELVYSVHVRPAADTEPYIRMNEEGKVEFGALLESVDQDGFAVFRMNDYIVTAIVSGSNIPTNIMVKVTPDRVVIFNEKRRKTNLRI